MSAPKGHLLGLRQVFILLSRSIEVIFVYRRVVGSMTMGVAMTVVAVAVTLVGVVHDVRGEES